MKDTTFNGKHVKMICAFEKGFGRGYPCVCLKRSFPPGYHDGFHNHDFPQIWYCQRGHYTHCIGDRQFECVKGSVIIVPPGNLHFFRIPKDVETELVVLDVMYDIFLDVPAKQYINAITNLFLPAFSGDLGTHIALYRTLCTDSQAILENIASWLISLQFNLHHFTPINQVLEKIEALFSLPEFAVDEKHHKNAIWITQTRLWPMLRVLTYLNLHYPEKITEEDLLGVAAMCRTDLYRNFKHLTGNSCFDYLRRLRINHAAAYMTKTAYSLSFISDVCGFSNLPHMSRIFKTYTGMSPSDFRKGRKSWIAQNSHRKRSSHEM